MEMNATVASRRDVTEDLSILGVRPDGPRFDFQPGQYTVLGLPASAPRAPGSSPDPVPLAPDKMIRRAYSIASASADGCCLEFYLKLVPAGSLTPRLFALREGDRLWIGSKAVGSFTLEAVAEGEDLILVATGTGLAPYLSMIRARHRCGARPAFTVVHGVRHPRELAYRDELEALDHGCATFRYVPTVTRPDESWTGHVGRVHAAFEDGTVAAEPGRHRVFLCGSPGMIDTMHPFFEARGFRLHTAKQPGNLHVERYW
jgi:ferredoxin--NADP+ reductase